MAKDQETIDKINKLINNMPRRSLNWKRSTDLYRELRVATTT
jgi:IS30 family transposase